MNLVNLLAQGVAQTFPLQASLESQMNFIGRFVHWLITITGSAGLGIILFTIALRLIVLPFDIYSKVKNKKNAVKMEAMKDDLDKLKQQYANDKNLYSQKMLALQKKNGYSPIAGCLPAILSLVIFFVAIDAFRFYSAFAMVEEYNSIVTVYNQSVEEIVEDYNAKYDGLFKSITAGEDAESGAETDGESAEQVKKWELDNGVFLAHSQELMQGTEFAVLADIIEFDGTVFKVKDSALEGGKFTQSAAQLMRAVFEENGILATSGITDANGAMAGCISMDEGGVHYTADDGFAGNFVGFAGEYFVKTNLNDDVAAIVGRVYKNDEKDAEGNERIKKSTFLWIKNVWMPDVSYEHPIPPNSADLASRIATSMRRSCSCRGEEYPLDSGMYDAVTAGLAEYKDAPNGYFILVVLSILSMFLSQFIVTRMQKASFEAQSVDGQAMMTQKMMMWMMPMIFGVFAFSYSSAFSIYMTVSSVISTLSSVLIGLAVDGKNKKPVAVEEGRSRKNLNRINNEKQRAEEEKKRKAEEKNKKKK